MTDYPAVPEGPDEINPAHLAVDKRAEVLLRDPSSYTVNPDGTQTHYVPEARWLEWSQVPLVEDPDNCHHGFSVCYKCADEWGIDYFMRFFDGDRLVWVSPDHPDASNLA